MQNRLVLTGIPPSVPRLPNAYDSLKEFVEDHSCWVDRFAFLNNNNASTSASDEAGCAEARGTKDNDNTSDSTSAMAAIELHIENVRDKAIKSLDGLVISMDEEGYIQDEGGDHGNAGEKHKAKSTKDEDSNMCISFTIHAYPATKSQSAILIQKCPLESDDIDAERRMEKQTLHLSLLLNNEDGNNDIELTVRKSMEHGGTGTYPWRGGRILSKQICHWANDRNESDSINAGTDSTSCGTMGSNRIDFTVLFCNKQILELGAGTAGIPSLTLGKISNILGYKMNLVSSDGVDEIVNALQMNVADNGLEDCIEVKHIDWNDYVKKNAKKEVTTDVYATKVDTIIFADCVYNEECATALSQTIHHLLKPGGYVIGVLPDFRVGLDLFEAQMKERNFTAANVPITVGDKDTEFACSGGGGKEYRLVLWKRK